MIDIRGRKGWEMLIGNGEQVSKGVRRGRWSAREGGEEDGLGEGKERLLGRSKNDILGGGNETVGDDIFED